MYFNITITLATGYNPIYRHAFKIDFNKHGHIVYNSGQEEMCVLLYNVLKALVSLTYRLNRSLPQWSLSLVLHHRPQR